MHDSFIDVEPVHSEAMEVIDHQHEIENGKGDIEGSVNEQNRQRHEGHDEKAMLFILAASSNYVEVYQYLANRLDIFTR